MRQTARLDLAGITQHIVQRSNLKQDCFLREADYHRYLAELREASLRFACALHAYVMMPNHVHLLVTPRTEGAVERMMQSLSRRYGRYFNESQNCISAIWERGYRSSFVDHERYAVMCYRYIELNPVRSGLVAAVQDYRWSSFSCNGLGYEQPLLTPHESFLGIAADPDERRAVYRALIAQGLGQQTLEAIRVSLQRQKALGSERFQRAIEGLLSPQGTHGVRELPMSYSRLMAG